MNRFGVVLALLLSAAAARSETVAVRGALVYPMSGPAISDGVVLVENGKIVRVGPAAEVAIPAGARVLSGAVVTPGLIDAHSTLGISGILNNSVPQGASGHDQDQLETSGPIQPDLRAVDAYNARDGLIDWARSLGVTTAHTGHGPGALVSGQTVIVKLRGETVEDALFDPARPVEMIAVTLGSSVMRNFRSPGSRPKSVAMLRAELVKARAYAEKRQNADLEKRPPRDLKLEVLADLLDKKIRALVTAQTATDILGALRLAREFGYDWVLDGAADAHRLLPEIKAAGVPVFLHPPMTRAVGDLENASFATAGKLSEAGIPFALQSGFEAYVPKTRLVLFEAAMLVAQGLSTERALATITLDAAKILRIDARVGSLEPGKDADLVIFDGDPFEYVSHVCVVVIDGVVVREECR
jgi:imidazolonepropionase-like amidohydrolase